MSTSASPISSYRGSRFQRVFAVQKSNPSSVFALQPSTNKEIGRLDVFRGSWRDVCSTGSNCRPLPCELVGVVWPNYEAEQKKAEQAEKGASEEKSKKAKSEQGPASKNKDSESRRKFIRGRINRKAKATQGLINDFIAQFNLAA
jgi:hypothetical protein